MKIPKYLRPAPCSLKTLFLHDVKGDETLYLDKYPEPLASIIGEYRSKYQSLQLEILGSSPPNCKELGLCFKKLDETFDKLLEAVMEMKPMC